MATAEEAIAAALGIPAAGITGWASDPETGELHLQYDGDPGFSRVNVNVYIDDVSTPEGE